MSFIGPRLCLSSGVGIMKLLKNSGTERVVDELRECLAAQGVLDLASPALSLFAFGELHDLLSQLASCRLVLPSHCLGDPELLSAESDRTYRNRLQVRWLARQCAAWLEAKAEVRT